VRTGLIFIGFLIGLIGLGGCAWNDDLPPEAMNPPEGTDKKAEDVKDTVEDEILSYLEKRLLSLQFGGVIGCAYEPVSEEWDGEQGKAYGWVLCIERLGDGIDGTGVSLPVVLTLTRSDADLEVTGHDIPADGTEYEASFQRLFPPSVRNRLSPENVNLDALEQRARERADTLR
jgi:hypothetical protein